jgi:hypothetical protein
MTWIKEAGMIRGKEKGNNGRRIDQFIARDKSLRR